MKIIEEELALYLEQNSEFYMELWKKDIIIDKTDVHISEVVQNGASMYSSVIHYLKGKTSLDTFTMLARKVGFERAQAKVNIGEFVYNVNRGRSIILDQLLKSPFSVQDLSYVTNVINFCFDHFLYHAVSHYTEIKDQDLEKKELFIRDAHKDRLTILGQMSASFVHEFRNPLTSVIGFIQLLQEEYPTLPYIDIINQELDQLKYRITQFLLVSKKELPPQTQKETFAVHSLVEKTLLFLYPTIVESDIEVFTQFDPNITLYGYSEEIRQVLINLIINSIDALQNEEHKTITISGTKDDTSTIISVINNGPKIPIEIVNTIFDPFVTTKELGTGIGLYVCRKIMEKHHGQILCESTDTHTTFQLVFFNND